MRLRRLNLAEERLSRSLHSPCSAKLPNRVHPGSKAGNYRLQNESSSSIASAATFIGVSQLVGSAIPSTSGKRPKAKRSSATVCPASQVPSATGSQTANGLNSSSIYPAEAKASASRENISKTTLNEQSSPNIESGRIRRRRASSLTAVTVNHVRKLSSLANTPSTSSARVTRILRKGQVSATKTTTTTTHTEH